MAGVEDLEALATVTMFDKAQMSELFSMKFVPWITGEGICAQEDWNGVFAACDGEDSNRYAAANLYCSGPVNCVTKESCDGMLLAAPHNSPEAVGASAHRFFPDGS